MGGSLVVALGLAGCGDGQVTVQDVLPGAPADFPPPPLDPAPLSIPYSPRPAGTLTFSTDVAPVVFRHCAGCHGMLENHPPRLTSYQEVAEHADAVLASILDARMPPWLPKSGFVEYTGQRGVSSTQLGIMRQWVQEGVAEGETGDLLPVEAFMPAPGESGLRPRAGSAEEVGRADESVPPGEVVAGPDTVAIPILLGLGERGDGASGGVGGGGAGRGTDRSEGVVFDRYILPVGVVVDAVVPAFGAYGQDVQVWALRPDGSREWLLRIGEWDPRWAERYRFRDPVVLPRGTTLALRVTFTTDQGAERGDAPLTTDPPPPFLGLADLPPSLALLQIDVRAAANDIEELRVDLGERGTPTPEIGR